MTHMPVPHAEGEPSEKSLLHDLGFFGHYLHIHRGGRNGKEYTLIKLFKTGGEMNQRELLEDGCVTSASLSEVLSKLETEGLVTRSRSAADRRQLTIALTPEGEARAREAVTRREAFESNAFACFTPQEQESLLAQLDRLAEHWDAIDDLKKDEDITCKKN